ncbi:unnamed protein product [Leuciscus chuanchicus]
MDPRDGHRECPSCLGMAHLREDVDNPCSAACDLPRGERLHRANRVCSSVPERGRKRERSSDRHSHKRSRRHSHDRHEHRSGHEKVVEVAKHPTPAPPAEGANTDTQLQILAAIQSLAQRMDRVEARHSFSPSLPSGQECVLPPAQQGNPDADAENDDVLSLIAPHSLVDNAPQAEGGSQGEGLHSDSAEVDDESTGKDDFPANSLVARVFSAAKILCLQPSVSDPAPVGGVWEGIPQTNSPSYIPVADDYTSMLRTAWKKPSQKPQFNAGCRRLANARYPKETGLGDMPPVEQEIASWTTLGPAYASANPRCPKKECAKTDRLISRSFNATARAARTGNALAILLAALRKTGRAFVAKDKILPLIPRGDFSPVGEPNREVHERVQDVMAALHRGQGLTVDSCASENGQYLSSLPHKSPRRDEITTLSPGGNESADVDRATAVLTESNPHPGCDKQSSRHFVQNRASPRRMAVAHGSNSPNLDPIRDSSCRSLCFQGDDPLPGMVLPHAGGSGQSKKYSAGPVVLRFCDVPCKL